MPITFTISNADNQIVSFKKIHEIQEFISQRFDGPVHVLIESEKVGEEHTLPPYVNIEGNPSLKLKKLPHYKTLEKRKK